MPGIPLVAVKLGTRCCSSNCTSCYCWNFVEIPRGLLNGQNLGSKDPSKLSEPIKELDILLTQILFLLTKKIQQEVVDEVEAKLNHKVYDEVDAKANQKVQDNLILVLKKFIGEIRATISSDI